MTELESLALLMADLNSQVRQLQTENAELRQLLEPGGRDPSVNPTDEHGLTGGPMR